MPSSREELRSGLPTSRPAATDSEPASPPAALAELQQKATSPIHYRLQRTFCGKASCKRCRDGGEGHGPYWYAYTHEHGQTKTYYLGKAVPDEKEQAPARGKRAGQRLAQQKPAHTSVSYHLQWSNCGKKRCRKCRDGGEGHGPYWYAYRIDEQGRTTRTYIGKELPEGVTADGAVAGA
jgi:hypothetical protein